MILHFLFHPSTFSVSDVRLWVQWLSAFGGARRKNAPTVPPDRLCSWFAVALRIDDEQLLDSIGLDALMYLKYLKLGFQLFLAFAVFGARASHDFFPDFFAPAIAYHCLFHSSLSIDPSSPKFKYHFSNALYACSIG